MPPRASTTKAKAQAEAALSAGKALDGAPALPLPELVTLASPYGFYDEDGAPCFWSVGQEVTDPDDIAVLIAREAPLVGIDYAAFAAAAAEAQAKAQAEAKAQADAQAAAEAQAKAEAEAAAAAAAEAEKAAKQAADGA